jgi:putative heme-binding domain-containing protein
MIKLTPMRLLILLAIAGLAGAQDKAPGDPASLAAGKKLYEFHCAFCHGKGDDGMAANLVTPVLVHAPSDVALVSVIKNGLGGGMPGALGMDDKEMWQVAGYVRSLARTAPTTVPGDAAAGKAVYNAKCAGCHMVSGQGGKLGPDLTYIGVMRSPSNLRTSILEPDAAMVSGWVMTHVTAKDGRKLSGIRLSEDQFQINLRAANGQLLSVAKADATSIQRDLSKSSMPSYAKTLSSTELDNLIAYLFTLRGGL